MGKCTSGRSATKSFSTAFEGCTMKNIITGVAVALVVWSSVPRAQEPPAPAAAESPTAEGGLNDLAAMTFGCPKAALNAAAREAAKVRSNGTYQFAFFRIVSDSHHASYEVRFKSNYSGEKELQYCVAMYCQQGWDPATAKATVTLMNDPRQLPGAHGAMCADKAKGAKPPAK
jgi:hypothetical protein